MNKGGCKGHLDALSGCLRFRWLSFETPVGGLKNIAFFVGVRPHYIVSHLVDFVKFLSCGLGQKWGVMFEKGGNVRIFNN
jgi:hypothetical protein